MSHLPKYSRDVEEGDTESAPLFKGDNRSSVDLEVQVPSYPPRRGEVAEGAQERTKVTYTFVPRWPMIGEREDAIGVMGLTKAEAISIVRSGFSRLNEIPSRRIEFLAPMLLDSGGRVVGDRWGIVMDEAWPALVKDPPANFKVQVQDGPGDAEARVRFESRRDLKKIIIAIGSVIFAFGSLATFFYLMVKAGRAR